ncbi:MAG: ComEC/Rec2 family competence protein [Clostridiaceae bacterium]
MKKNRLKKPLWKRWWVWVLAILFVIGALGDSETPDKDNLIAGINAGIAIESPAEVIETSVGNNKTPIVVVPIENVETPGVQPETVQENPVVILPTTINKDLKVHFIDVGQGDSIFIELPNGQSMLIDAGESGNGSQVLSYLKKLGYTKLDYVVVTHPHADHIGGMTTIINGIDIGSLYMPKKEHTTKTFENMIDALTNNNVDVYTANAGVGILNLDGLSVNLLGPVSSSYTDLNNFSAVVMLKYKNNSFLFMGDAEALAEGQLSSVKADVLKIGHHGSDSSTSASFLSKVSPKYAVISVGAGNSYGHPADTTITKLKNAGIITYRTDQLGTIIFTSNGSSISVDKEPGAVVIQNTPPVVAPTPAPAPAPAPVPEPDPEPAVPQTITVYITKTGAKYHMDGCRYLSESKISISLDDAKKKGYTPCGVCKPPQ